MDPPVKLMAVDGEVVTLRFEPQAKCEMMMMS